MSNKSLPAVLRQVLEEHVAHADLSRDAELENIFVRLNQLNDKVEQIKMSIVRKKTGVSE